MDKETQKLVGMSGMMLGAGIILGSAFIAQEAYGNAHTSTGEAQESFQSLGDTAFAIDLGGVAITLASGVIFSRSERRSSKT